MADVFTNDLRIREQESGSNAGTWGGLLNTTIRNIASAFGQGSETIPNASTHTITLADGTADEARSMYLKCTGGGQACTVTLAPNTISKVWIISNETSFTLTFTQGSGANVAVAAGSTKMIVTDGAGSGAAVTDALSGLDASLSGLTVDTTTLVVDATNNNVGIGTTSPSSFYSTSLVVNVPDEDGITIVSPTTGLGYLMFADGTSGNARFRGFIGYEHDGDLMQFATGGTERMRIDSSGNALVGRTDRLTSQSSSISSNTVMSVHGPLASHQTNAGILQYNGNVFELRAYGASAGTGEMSFNTGGGGGGADTERMRIDSAGNVGIGTSSPSSYGGNLAVSGTGSIINARSSSGTSAIGFWENVSSRFFLATLNGSDGLAFIDGDGSSERMRIDSSGNFCVGTTNPAPVSNNVQGVSIRSFGELQASRDNAATLYLNRKTSDGTLVVLRRDNADTGYIGTEGGDSLFIISGNSGLRFAASNRVIPCGTNGAVRDNIIDLGSSSARFDDVFATNGTIQTSDRTEKQDINSLSDAEQRVAVAAKGLMRKFRWKDSVAEKGEEARIHFGIMAQDLQDAFTAEGLDAGQYAMFISNTWWETQTEVPAVEAVEATEDTEAIEATDAYILTSTYDTAEEAPEGATERTRLGVRYTELLAFIISAI